MAWNEKELTYSIPVEMLTIPGNLSNYDRFGDILHADKSFAENGLDLLAAGAGTLKMTIFMTGC